MPTFAFLSSKGGSGKSTLAICCAVRAGNALLLDTDPQRSCAGWYETRPQERRHPVCAVADLSRLSSLPEGYDHTIIDTPPHSDVRRAIERADLAVIVAQPTILDLRAISATIRILQGFSRAFHAVVVLNRCPPPRVLGEHPVVREAQRALAAYGLPVCPVPIRQRAVYQYAIAAGLSPEEFEPGGKAAREIAQLWEYLHEQATRA